jgi:hypothetical protein
LDKSSNVFVPEQKRAYANRRVPKELTSSLTTKRHHHENPRNPIYLGPPSFKLKGKYEVVGAEKGDDNKG